MMTEQTLATLLNIDQTVNPPRIAASGDWVLAQQLQSARPESDLFNKALKNEFQVNNTPETGFYSHNFPDNTPSLHFGILCS